MHGLRVVLSIAGSLEDQTMHSGDDVLVIQEAGQTFSHDAHSYACLFALCPVDFSQQGFSFDK